jgi:hypothetical protein
LPVVNRLQHRLKASERAGQLNRPRVVERATTVVRGCIDFDQQDEERGCSEAKPVYDWHTQLIHAPPDSPDAATRAAGAEVARVLLNDRAEFG